MCDNTECITEYSPETKEKYLFCCCRANMCNARVSWKIIPNIIATGEPITGTGATNRIHYVSMELLLDPVVWLALAIIFLLMLTLILIAILRRTGEDIQKPESAPLSPTGPGYSSNLQNVDNLKLISLLDQGKYGTVWKGMVNERNVAVKIFPSHHKQYFLNERDIYNIPLMEHKSLLVYLGCDERRTIDDRIEYMLVMSWAQLGCLQDWLIDNTTSVSQFLKMATGIAQGLSHLHSVIRKGGLVKPSVCHRDLNSRNILVKADMSCCIADFGFALKTFGPRYEYRGEMTLAETKSIMEVGTLRYMAPEVLEGAVNLKDCESALKQIDVYSLALVIWELATRCQDFYGKETVPGYLAPYESEIGKHPSYEQMQILVSRQKVRPSFASSWGCGSTTKVIKETCEDCWDADSEARLTSLCVEERLKDLCRDRKTHGSNFVTNINEISKIRRSSPNSPNDGIIRTPTKQIIMTEESFNYREQHHEKEYLKHLTKSSSKGHLAKPMKKDKIPFKLPGKKTKKNKIGKTFQRLHGVRTMIQKKLFKRMKLENDDLSNSITSSSAPPTPKTVAVRPTNLDIIPQRYCPPKRIIKPPVEAATEDEIKARLRSLETKKSAKLDKKFVNSRLSLQPIPDFPDLHLTNPPVDFRPRIVVSKSATTMRNLEGLTMAEQSLKRQRSIEVFREVFGSGQSSEHLHLRDPSERVKTPGDLPPSVRKSRATKTLSLYDDRMMGWDSINTI